MYRFIPREQIIDSIGHLRDLLRSDSPSDQFQRLKNERLEIISKYMISNLRKTGNHPTLNTLLEVADTFSLTLGATHELFGYDLEAVRQYDLQLNAGRTHIVESYVFDRDKMVDVPSELASLEAFASDAMLMDLVLHWQSPYPFRVWETAVKNHRRGILYVQVGTEDSDAASLPPGSIGLVEPVNEPEALRPNPRSIYLLQFPNGYRCSRCVVTRGKLHLLHSTRSYRGPQEFAYPGSVRLVGRVRTFAHALPQPQYQPDALARAGNVGAPLILPWEHRTRDQLLATKHKRFQRSKTQQDEVRNLLNVHLQSKISARTERRYRRPSSSEPHVNALIQMTLAHFARYSDTLRASGQAFPDLGRFSLQTLLNARGAGDLENLQPTVALPRPSSVWSIYGREFIDYAPLVAFKFPQVRLRGDAIVRLATPSDLKGLEPPLGAGSWVLLNTPSAESDTNRDRELTGWSRPFYVMRRNLEILMGYLDRDGTDYALLSHPHDRNARVTSLRAEEVLELRRVAGVVVPV